VEFANEHRCRHLCCKEGKVSVGKQRKQVSKTQSKKLTKPFSQDVTENSRSFTEKSYSPRQKAFAITPVRPIHQVQASANDLPPLVERPRSTVPETPSLKEFSFDNSQSHGLPASASKSSKARTVTNGSTSSFQIPQNKIESRPLAKAGARNEPRTGLLRNKTVSFSILDDIQSDDSDDLPSPEDMIRMLQSKEKVVANVKHRHADERFQALDDITERSRNKMQEDNVPSGECNENLGGGGDGGFTIEDILGCVDIV
jgi:hypothetical protein